MKGLSWHQKGAEDGKKRIVGGDGWDGHHHHQHHQQQHHLVLCLFLCWCCCWCWWWCSACCFANLIVPFGGEGSYLVVFIFLFCMFFV